MMGGKTPANGDTTDPLIGRVLNDRFEIVRLIGRGGVGAVYLAMQAPLDRPCALKVLRPRYQEGDQSKEFHRRFFLEASTAAKLRHPNNVAVFDYGRTDDDMYFMAMEYLEGRTLREALRKDGAFDEERTAHIARQVCRALREAHHQGVIHRDIKPSNIFLLDRHDETDVVKVLDFGLVKDVTDDDANLTQANSFMGSPKYVSPEQIQSATVDARTDIYALGVVLYEMVTGRVPFDGGATVKTLIAHIKEDVPPLRDTNPACNVTPRLEQIIYRCIAKDPANRFASMDELLAVLRPDGAQTLMTDSEGRLLIDSGALAISGSVPLPTTVTAREAAASGASRPMAPYEDGTGATVRSTWMRRHGKTLLAGGLVLSAIVATVVLMGRQDHAPMTDSSVGAGSVDAEVFSSAPSSPPPAVVSASDSANAPEPERVVVLSTAPVSASVQLPDGKQLCEETPCRIPVGLLADGALTIAISAPGYINIKKKIGTEEDEVSVQLTPIPIRTAPNTTTTAAVPTGYKGDPFGEMPPY